MSARPHEFGQVRFEAPAAHPAATPRLSELLREMQLSGATHAHLEVVQGGARLRLRDPSGLSTRRVAEADLLHQELIGQLDGAVALADDRWQSNARLPDGGRLSLLIDRVPLFDGVCWQVTPLHPPAPCLETLLPDAASLGRLRTTLARHDGLILLSAAQPEALTPLAGALAAACIAPDRQVLRIEAVGQQRLPGALMMSLAHLQTPRREATCRALLGRDLDVVVTDAGLPASLTPLLDACAAHRLMIRTDERATLQQVLPRLRAAGASGEWQAEHLRCVIRLERIRTLCPSCRQSVDTMGDTAFTPARRALQLSLHGLAESVGCDDCLQTGFGGCVDVIEVLEPGPDVLTCLQTDDVRQAALNLRRQSVLEGRMESLMHQGIVGMRESARLLRD